MFRIFGRDAGFTALYAAYVTSARCLIPEAPYDLDALAALLAEDHAANPSHYAFVVAAEGAIWEGGRSRRGRRGRRLRAPPQGRHRRGAGRRDHARGPASRRSPSELTYDLRSGEPDALDQIVATTFANVAMDLVADGSSGRMVAIRDGKYARHRPAGPGARRAASTSTGCTTSSASGRATTAGSGGRCCSSAWACEVWTSA